MVSVYLPKLKFHKERERITSNKLNAKRASKPDSKTGGVFNRTSQHPNRVLPSDDSEEKLDTQFLYDFKQEIIIS